MARYSYEIEKMNSNLYFNNNRRKTDRRYLRSRKSREKNQNIGATAIFISRRTMIILGILTGLFLISTLANIGVLIQKEKVASKY